MFGDIFGGVVDGLNNLVGLTQNTVNLAQSIDDFGLNEKYYNLQKSSNNFNQDMASKQYKLQKDAYNFDKALNTDQWVFNRDLASMQWQQALNQMYSGHQIEMNDLKAAGINPMLAIEGSLGGVQMPGNVSANALSAGSPGSVSAGGGSVTNPRGDTSRLGDFVEFLRSLDPDKKKQEKLDMMDKEANLDIKQQQAELVKAQKDAILHNIPGVQVQETKRYHDAQIRAQEARNEILKSGQNSSISKLYDAIKNKVNYLKYNSSSYDKFLDKSASLLNKLY